MVLRTTARAAAKTCANTYLPTLHATSRLPTLSRLSTYLPVQGSRLDGRHGWNGQ